MSAAKPTCAVWYVSHYSLYYRLCDDEEAAARFAVYMMDDGHVAVLGIQFAAGNALKRDEWPAYQAEEHRLLSGVQVEAAKQEPQPVRHVKSPLPWAFPDEAIEVEATEPSWLGA